MLNRIAVDDLLLVEQFSKEVVQVDRKSVV